MSDKEEEEDSLSSSSSSRYQDDELVGTTRHLTTAPGNENVRKHSRAVVRSFKDAVRKYVWQSMKFNRDQDLVWGSSMSRSIVKYMDIGRDNDEVEMRRFWYNHRELLPFALRTIRNGVVQATKESLSHLYEGRSPYVNKYYGWMSTMKD